MTIHHDKLAYGKLASTREELSEDRLLEMLSELESEAEIRESTGEEAALRDILALSEAWERENSCYGYRKSEKGDIEGRRIFTAEREGKTVGYLFGRKEYLKNTSSVAPDGTEYFEIEEIYVVAEYRSMGIGRALYEFLEERLKEEGTDYIFLSTATKDWRKIFHFYIEELGMEFWSARLFKKLR